MGDGRATWGAGADAALVLREQELRRAITELSGQLAPREAGVLALRGAADPSAAPLVAREALARAEAERTELLVTLRARAPRYAGLVEGRTTGWRDVAAALPAGTVLLEYLLSDSAAALFVVDRGGVHALDLGSDRRTIASQVEFARGTLAKPSGATASRAVLERLFRTLVEPAESAGLLRGATRLLVVPHAELHYLPFAALRQPGGGYLVERFAIATVPSASVWLQAEGRAPRARASGRVLALAPVAAQLPGTQREVEAIAALAPASTTVLLGTRATRGALERALPSADVLHLATYGVLNRRNPLFSHVELAAPAGGDGRLEVHDVHGLTLDLSLVVLSACQTGVGSGLQADVPAGDEWVGMAQAFLSAGARRVMATLWLVDDQATAELMTRFHAARRQGGPTSDALATVQRGAIGDARFGDPYYWAGIQLMGGL
ncbi:MAG: CHAT domain-containing protein [Gemmatimonadales bacterium]|nr:CHAT domain-containing protein [Gemmatimonadales bacterium]